MIKWDDTYEQQLKAMSDADLIAAYRRTIDDAGHPPYGRPACRD